MDETTMLSMLKVDLGITTNAYDDRLTQYLQTAASEIEREGITLDRSDTNDSDLQIMYASWLWTKRREGTGMPRMLRWRLNNRLFSEKVD